MCSAVTFHFFFLQLTITLTHLATQTGQQSKFCTLNQGILMHIHYLVMQDKLTDIPHQPI